MAGNTGKSEAEAMEELARQMWERYFKYKASDLLEHSLDGYKATVTSNNGDGTLSVSRPYDDTEVTLKCPPSLAANAGAGDQVLVITLGNLSNAFILCKTDLTGLGGGGDMLRPEEYDFSTIPTSDYFTETLENGDTTRYNVEMDESGRIVSITDTTDGFETTIVWGSLNWNDQADEVDYDNTSSGLTATNVQAALDELTGRYIGTTLFSTLTDVATDTTITLTESHSNYKFLMLVFNSRSPAAAGYRMPLTITNQELRQGGYYPLRNPEVDGYVRVNFISGQNTQIRIQDTNIASLYLASVTGLR